MSFTSFMDRTVQILRAPYISDRYNDSSQDWPNAQIVATVKGWAPPEAMQREDNKDRQEVWGDATLFLPAGTDVTAQDRGTLDGRLFQVLGNPSRPWAPRGEHHVEVRIEFITG